MSDMSGSSSRGSSGPRPNVSCCMSVIRLSFSVWLRGTPSADMSDSMTLTISPLRTSEPIICTLDRSSLSMSFLCILLLRFWYFLSFEIFSSSTISSFPAPV